MLFLNTVFYYFLFQITNHLVMGKNEYLQEIFGSVVKSIRCGRRSDTTYDAIKRLVDQVMKDGLNDNIKKISNVERGEVPPDYITRILMCDVKYQDYNNISIDCQKRKSVSAMKQYVRKEIRRHRKTHKKLKIRRKKNKKTTRRRYRNKNVQAQPEFSNAYKDFLRKQTGAFYEIDLLNVTFCKKTHGVLVACDVLKFRTYSCKIQPQKIAFKQLCNGIKNCEDASDEKNCYIQVAEELKNAKELMSKLQDSLLETKCHRALDAEFIVLMEKLRELERYNDNARNTISGIVHAVDKIYVTLDDAFCSNKPRKKAHVSIPINTRRMNINRGMRAICTCFNNQCKNACQPICKETCERRYLLSRFNCPDGNNHSVPIKRICDGKFDCDDNSDETDCSKGGTEKKFIAYNILTQTDKSLQLQIARNEYTYVVPMLLKLQQDIKGLHQNLTKSFRIENLNEGIFESIANVIPKSIDTTQLSLENNDSLYHFLMTINKNITMVIKLILKDEIKVVMAEGCLCRKHRCGVRGCSKRCERACSVTSTLTMYECEGTMGQRHVALEALCDREQQCPAGDDENRCSRVLCQKYHFMAMLGIVKTAGSEQYEGASLGEMLKLWKSNVTTKIENVLKGDTRPSHIVLVNVTKELLTELTLLYGSISDVYIQKRPDSEIIMLLWNISKKFIDYVKSCNP